MSHQHKQNLHLSTLHWRTGGFWSLGNSAAKALDAFGAGARRQAQRPAAGMTHRPLFLFPGKGVSVSVSAAWRALSKPPLRAAARFRFPQNPGVGTDTHAFA